MGPSGNQLLIVVRAELCWEAPAADGGAAITRYQSKVKKNGQWRKWIPVSPDTNSQGKAKKTYKKLKAEKKYRVKVRAVNGVGSGPVAKKKFRTSAKS